ncbi:MAG TPA: TSUP family transporter [Bdellovibrionota bacterium]|nr:TSUP family transporter [Bdellovibrionota bacterium]
MNAMWGYLAVGFLGGIFAGFFGVGGGIVLVPILVWLFGMSQHQAQGISLAALLLPVGALGFWTYYRANPFPLTPALMIAIGLFLGGYFGGSFAQILPDRPLRIAFGILTVAAGIKLILGK